MRDINQEIFLLEGLDHVFFDGGSDFGGGSCGRVLRDEDTCMEFVFADVVGEGAHLLDADAGIVRGKFDPDSANIGSGRWITFGGTGSVFLEHGGRGTGRKVHFPAAARGSLGTRLYARVDG